MWDCRENLTDSVSTPLKHLRLHHLCDWLMYLCNFVCTCNFLLNIFYLTPAINNLLSPQDAFDFSDDSSPSGTEGQKGSKGGDKSKDSLPGFKKIFSGPKKVRLSSYTLKWQFTSNLLEWEKYFSLWFCKKRFSWHQTCYRRLVRGDAACDVPLAWKLIVVVALLGSPSCYNKTHICYCCAVQTLSLPFNISSCSGACLVCLMLRVYCFHIRDTTVNIVSLWRGVAPGQCAARGTQSFCFSLILSPWPRWTLCLLCEILC